MGFVHLHLHTQYSLLEGAIRVDELMKRAKSLGMTAVGMTDTHNLFGAIDFYTEAKKAGLKPIIGCELIYSPYSRAQITAPAQATAVGGQAGPQVPKFHHLVALCKDLRGYQNLCKMVSRSYEEFQPGQKLPSGTPRAWVDRSLLDQFGDGLVILSGCLRGEIPVKLLFGEEEGALESLQWFKRRFGPDFYLELQDGGLPEQAQVNDKLVRLGERFEVPVVATSDCHYLDAGDAEAHEVLQCIEHGKNLDFDRPKSLVPSHYDFATEAQMRERFAQYPQACDATLEIAEKCKLEFRFKDEQGRPIYHLPDFRPSDVAPAERASLAERTSKDAPFDLIAYFREQTQKGLLRRFEEPGFLVKRADAGWAELEPKYHQRLDDELRMIEKTGFSGYFLIVADFINWAKDHDIPVGPGRGSGAGSLVAYSLRITDLDPIEFNLLFERFINPERISMPDFDVDFCQDRRGEVIEYVARKYGAENVSQIITFGKLQTKAVIKDVGRVLGLSFAESDSLTKLVPDELGIGLADAIAREPRLKERMDSDARLGKVMSYALTLEGLNRNAGIHAAGVIITQEPIVHYCPLYVSKDGDRVIQFDKDFAEKVGLVKFDFLGLKTLTVIDNAVKLVRAGAQPGTRDADFRLESMSYTDAPVFALIGSGDTDGVFQVESSGMKDLCARIQPGSLEDLTAINALYRPGPLGSGMVDDFIDRKHGRKQNVYDVPALEPILRDTYGVILYQEQVMQIARELAGYSLGQADLLRRAMGKKKPEEMAQHRELFVTGATKKGLPAAKAESIFDLMAKFAEYGFNKSHSAAYGVLTYQTAYLKTHYPSEFMAALMTTEMDNTDKITKYIGDARAHQISVLGPDVNRSQKRFSVETAPKGASEPVGERSNEATAEESAKAIRFGLEAIKGVGGIAVDAILEARAAGPFTSVLDFCKRVPTRKVNRKVLESLILAGGLDSVAEVNRPSLFASVEGLLEHAGDEQQERELGQSSLFDQFTAEEIKLVTPASAVFKSEADWPQPRKLAMEKQVLGVYVSGHPMDPWQRICEDWLGWSTERLRRAHETRASSPQPAAPPQQEGRRPFRAPKQEVRIAGLLSEFREVMTKKGARMAFAQLEDLSGKVEVLFFPETYANLQEILKRALAEAEPVVVTADIEFAEEAPKLLIKEMDWVAEAHKNRVQQVVLKLNPSQATPDQMRALKQGLLAHRGRCAVRIEFVDKSFKTRMELPKTVRVAASPQMVESINRIFGQKVVTLL